MNTGTPVTTHFRRSFAAGVAATALLSFATLSLAGSDEEILRVTVRYADLDVSHPTGAAVLYHRIHTAAKEVCAPRESLFDGGIALNACIDQAVLDAVNAVNQQALSAVLEAKRHASPAAGVVSQVSENR